MWQCSCADFTPQRGPRVFSIEIEYASGADVRTVRRVVGPEVAKRLGEFNPKPGGMLALDFGGGERILILRSAVLSIEIKPVAK